MPETDNIKKTRLDDGSHNKTPDSIPQKWIDSVAPHVDSFNWFLANSVRLYLNNSAPTKVLDSNIELFVESMTIGKPVLDGKPMYPHICRQMGITYEAPLLAKLVFRQDANQFTVERIIGKMPIMVKSTHCHLHGMSPKELVAHYEEDTEVGGYFIINGNEKIIRLLNTSRRHDIVSYIRPSLSRMGAQYTPYAVSMKCVRPDQTTQTLHLHYCRDGSVSARIIIKRKEYLIPVALLLKALVDTSDREIYGRIVQGDTEHSMLLDAVEIMLREFKKKALYSREQCLSHLGSGFRLIMREFVDAEMDDIEAGQALLDNFVLVHLSTHRDKFNTLILMVRKLYALVQGRCSVDNLDSVMNHEVLLPGHLWNSMFQERVRMYCYGLSSLIRKFNAKNTKSWETPIKKACESVPDLCQKMKTFLSTGNLTSESGLDLMQASGFTVIADKLNYLRYMSHFQCIHRGAFFAEMKTTLPRKLLPEAWGFVCPVHTPDGGPCGLLNHLAVTCKVPIDVKGRVDIEDLLSTLGLTNTVPSIHASIRHLDVMLDGRYVGKVAENIAEDLVSKLRFYKVKGLQGVPRDLEIAHVPYNSTGGGRFPGIFMFSGPARFTRPVRNLLVGEEEMIGSFEQVYMNIACMEGDRRANSTHQEILPTNILSAVATMTPFSDFNQSPRNMYQCQMGKQTMGTPLSAYPYRCDNKLYRIQNPQMPLVRTFGQHDYAVNNYPTGANAIVAVISYTGYDMEDAMIINKSSYERGFGHGSVYKTEYVDASSLAETNELRSTPQTKCYFHNVGLNGQLHEPSLDEDGLPAVGQLIKEGDPLYCVYDPIAKQFSVKKYKTNEECYIDDILVIDPHNAHDQKVGPEHVVIKLRYNRNPVIGDKFSSRHGQKGVLSQLWPQIDMPFSESGMTPDVIINPHAFPSRMTIGMLVESMAAKSGALHGVFHDATPFRFNEKERAVDYFGEQLIKAGYNYYGNEPLYSGISGQEFHADIYLGVVYYQRLRHMVKDKFQVRSNGPINSLTQQPIKGRKKGGGIRFGEMERDSMLAHGTAFLLNDRLYNCSDRSTACVCSRCGSILAPISVTGTERGEGTMSTDRVDYCRNCQTDQDVKVVDIPAVFKYLTAELAAMNLKSTLTIK
ncbi:hypothetical protein PROFUN_12271 [Planoprotostelium fungivorum]|uniref:DNA-directed RNA polymerase subunit beta n=1 Tax=Planoprotostelium fungivorum TaxID=1890364 RepID=A0A2P6N829_9EUKA|nr:hypothetical protein PROFUN_12271 [Planoprotostelium fungivorum]